MISTGPHRRYRSFAPLTLPDRTWPDRRPTQAPRWLSTDLRDGNQALAEPMGPELKLVMFELLAGMGYREIEVGFPSASQDEFDFLRLLIEQERIPEGVSISVMVPAREELIRRTVDALAGARHATLHLYNATAPLFRELVYGMSRSECRQLAVDSTRMLLREVERGLSDCAWGFQYSPELFNETEPEFALEVCEAVMDVWQPGPERPIIINVPSTVERSQVHVFADQIEWLDRNLSRREHVCLSVHPHNDRGTAVAATELALLAGAQRVEGCLFGGGERAGNVCLVTLGLNLLTQGVDPGIDFSDLGRVRRTVERCTGMAVHDRHPYAGALVHTAFSGAHQDAIRKGFAARGRAARAAGVEPGELPWEMPYLPIDPADLGLGYEALVRITSQSGKGGITHVLAGHHGLHLPQEFAPEFARLVQRTADREGGELGPDRLLRLLEEEYRVASSPRSRRLRLCPGPVPTSLYVDAPLERESATELREALAPWGVEVVSVREAAPGLPHPAPDGAGVAVFAACDLDTGRFWGLHRHHDPATAALMAVRAATARAGFEPAVPVPVEAEALA